VIDVEADGYGIRRASDASEFSILEIMQHMDEKLSRLVGKPARAEDQGGFLKEYTRYQYLDTPDFSQHPSSKISRSKSRVTSTP